MAFLTVEDLVGTAEVIVFPKNYEQNREILVPDMKIFAEGRVSVEEDKPAKLILENVRAFKMPEDELWIQFDDKDRYLEEKDKLGELIKRLPGNNPLVIYLKKEKAVKRFSENYNVDASEGKAAIFIKSFGEANVRLVHKQG